MDATGPLTSGVTATPTPNNGAQPFNSSVPAVRVIATTMTDPISGAVNSPIATAEAFLDTPGADGSGIRLIASDGVFNDPAEGGYMDIPLATVAAMSSGPHTVYVHAKDAAGNWGATAQHHADGRQDPADGDRRLGGAEPDPRGGVGDPVRHRDRPGPGEHRGHPGRVVARCRPGRRQRHRR